MDPFEALIVGGGPAGASAAIYLARKGLRTGIVAERFGGQLNDTLSIENYPSVAHTEGPRMVADLDPHEGDAFLAGGACSGMPAPAWRRQVRYVPADAGWWAETVAPHFPPDFDFAVLLPAVGIEAAARDWPVARLSTGERQRLALLRAMRPAVRVLLLDEPTSGLDPDAVAQVEALLRAHLARGGGLRQALNLRRVRALLRDNATPYQLAYIGIAVFAPLLILGGALFLGVGALVGIGWSFAFAGRLTAQAYQQAQD